MLDVIMEPSGLCVLCPYSDTGSNFGDSLVTVKRGLTTLINSIKKREDGISEQLTCRKTIFGK